MHKPHVYDEYKQGKATFEELLQAVRSSSHAFNDSERERTVDLLGSLGHPDAQRELLLIYQTSQWRSTRIRIVSALHNRPSERSLEFLIALASDESDIPLCEEAIWSLGKSNHPLAARFLINAYRHASAVVKPFIVGALGEIPNRSLSHEFLQELPNALADNNLLLAKNLVLSLAELKVVEAIPIIEKIIKDDSKSSLALPAFVAYGKLARQDAALKEVENNFRSDLFEHQMLTSAKTQIQFRAQWTLEDYLKKIFESDEPHPMLPFELNTFSKDDVHSGLQLFTGAQNRKKLLSALSKLEHETIADWYDELVPAKGLSDDEKMDFMESIQAHHGTSFQKLLEALRPQSTSIDDPLFDKWLQTISLCLPNADLMFRELFQETFEGFDQATQISAINHYVNYALSLYRDEKRKKAIARDFEKALAKCQNDGTRARLVRAIAQIGVAGNSIFQFLKEHASAPAIAPSALFYFERCPSKQAAELVLALLDRENANANRKAILRCLTTQPAPLPDHAKLEGFVRDSLSPKSAPDVRRLALMLLSAHPLPKLYPDVAACVEAEESVVIAATIALKTLQDERAIEVLGQLLSSSSVSIQGRALDALVSFKQIRAKALVIDYLESNIHEHAVCEKVIRCLLPPPAHNPALFQRLEKLALQAIQHPLHDGFLALRDRFSLSAPKLDWVNEADLRKIDDELAKQIPIYRQLDEQAKAALRAAELPFLQSQIFEGRIDKSMSVVLYCKALDITLDKVFGQNILFPRMESALHSFQNVLHGAGLTSEHFDIEKVVRFFSLSKGFTNHNLPLAKMSSMSREFLSGRIMNAHWKILDGLRAWAVVLLMFARNTDAGRTPAVVPIKGLSDDDIVQFCKKLLDLQDARNPVAHRQTLIRFSDIQTVRTEVFLMFKQIERML